jgi:hypothetical protein
MGKVSDLFKLKILTQFGKGDSEMPTIDWRDPKAKISKYFTVKEACWLPTWGQMHIPNEEEKQNIVKMAQTMDLIREFIQHPITVICWIRPVAYNSDPRIGGAPKSMHITGRAVDWTIGQDCDNIRKLIFPQLAFWNIRMEDLPHSKWIHVDNKEVSNDKFRFFKP